MVKGMLPIPKLATYLSQWFGHFSSAILSGKFHYPTSAEGRKIKFCKNYEKFFRDAAVFSQSH